MAHYNNPGIVTTGLVFAYDMNNRAKSWFGAPTTNLNSGASISTYLNTPSDVTSSLTQTTELYKGQPVYKQVLTPITSTGVSYLTNANNPGIGVVTGGGGGLANKYTGHSIFFKPALGRNGLNSSTPIYTHYSNISGWQTSGNYDDMGDGWYRAHVIYYNSSGGSDGKYWAINPAGASLNVPITIYWAAPFKEDRNDSTFVSAYTYSSRSSTQAVVDLINNYTLTANNLSYNSDGTFNFSGSSYLDLNSTNIISGTNPFTVDAFYTTSGSTADEIFGNYGSGYTSNNLWISGRYGAFISGAVYFPGAPIAAGTYHICVTRDGNGNVILYKNGIQVNSGTLAGSIPTNINYRIGADVNGGGEPFTGKIYNVKVYNRNLSASEVLQNFSALRGRYGV